MARPDKAPLIRNESEADHEAVERLIREAFYNIYMPGCAEHYLARAMRRHPDFIPELDFVMELDGEIIGSILYTKSWLEDAHGCGKEIATFGPLSILPRLQRQGYGKALIRHSLKAALELGYEAAVIFGSPANYVSSGFKSCKKYKVASLDGKYPAAMLVRELVPGALEGSQWFYRESSSMAVDMEQALAYDSGLPEKERKYLPSQEEFFILSHAFIE